jgi:hypothetical protein
MSTELPLLFFSSTHRRVRTIGGKGKGKSASVKETKKEKKEE